MSKSVGNVIDPFDLVKAYGASLRYFFLREVPFGQDGNYSHEAIINRINANLANDLGNLAQRSLTMVARQFAGALPEPAIFSAADEAILTAADAMIDNSRDYMKTQQLHQVLNTVWAVVADANRYFAGEAPWALAKTDPARQGTVLYVTAEVIRQVAILCQPFMPEFVRQTPRFTCRSARAPKLRRSWHAHFCRREIAGADTGVPALRRARNTSGAVNAHRQPLPSRFSDFADELDAVVARAGAAGIARLVTISTRVARHAGVLSIAERFPDVYCSVGTHPHHAEEELDTTADDLIARAKHPKVVAIGEAGLDYHYDRSPRSAQEQGFRTHIEAARESGLPLVIHSRDADADMARILEEETGQGAFPAVLHCFTGGRELARRAIALRLFISFTGILTFKNSAALRTTVAAELPPDRILVETDAPYLAPSPFPRQARRARPRRRGGKSSRRDTRRVLRRDRAANHRQFLCAVSQGAATDRR